MSSIFDKYYQHSNRNSSNRIEKLKAATIYAGAKSNVSTGYAAKGPEKNIYNGGVYANPITKCVIHTDSYGKLLNLTKGESECKPNIGAPIYLDYGIYNGSTLEANMVNTVVTNTALNHVNYNEVEYPAPQQTISSVNNLNYPGMVVDPRGQIFGNKCAPVPYMKPSGDPPTFINPSNASLFEKQIAEQREYPNFAFPKKMSLK